MGRNTAVVVALAAIAIALTSAAPAFGGPDVLRVARRALNISPPRGREGRTPPQKETRPRPREGAPAPQRGPAPPPGPGGRPRRGAPPPGPPAGSAGPARRPGCRR